jgi:ubiquinone/menaquinone biosynthesis C-methylase UbiE
VTSGLKIAAENGHFDAVISRHGLTFVEDVGGAVQEAARVLRPA